MNFRFHPRFHLHKPFALAVVILGVAAPLHAQRGSPDPFFDSVPFKEWMARGNQKQIPWTVEIPKPRLSAYQRLVVSVRILVPGKELLKRSGGGSLNAFVQIIDHQGNIYQDHFTLAPKQLEKEVKKQNGQVTWNTFFVPGEYSVALALYDRESNLCSFTQRQLRIDPLPNDPMPRAWDGLPSVELPAHEEGLDEIYRTNLVGRLHLPLPTRRHVRVNLVMNLTSSEKFAASRTRYMQNLRNLLPALRCFGQIDLWNGALNVATLDLTRRRVNFEQQRFRELDWPKLRDSLAEADPSSIAVADLQDQAKNEGFLRSEIERRLAAPMQNTDEKPLRVFIFVSSPMAFNSALERQIITMPEDCDCVFYYIQYNLFAFEQRRKMHAIDSGFLPGDFGLPDSGPDEIERMLKPLKPKVFYVESPGDFRAALAGILADLSKQ